MNKIKFWNNWDTANKYPYLFLLTLCLIALLLGVYHYFTGDNYVFAWDKISDLQVVPVPVNEVTRLLEPFTLSTDAYLLFEQYDVAQPKVNVIAACAFLAILSVALAYYAAAISTMKRFAYFGAALLLMLFLATFNFDLLNVFGNNASQTTLLISIVLLVGVSYGFHAFWHQVHFVWRVLVMLLVFALLGGLIFSEASLPAPLVALHLVNYSSLGTLVVTVLFMIWVSYENVNALLWINTQAKIPERRFSLWQFILISVLYLANLLLLYLRHVGYIQTDLIYVNAYIILIFSTVAGFWGMRQREAFYKGLFPFRPTGAVLYLVFGTIAFLSIGYAFATSNDTLTSLYHDAIVHTHLAYGFMFFVYIMVNFGRMLEERVAVYKVVYDPKSLSLFSFFLMGTIVLAILVMRTQYRTYFYAQGGYYNYIGDFYRASDNTILAERFYEESDVFDANNVKANYSLAGLYREQEQRNNEILRLQDALLKRPNPKLYIRLANMYDEKKYFFEKLYVLQQGVEKFPESAELYNNLALLYTQTSITDSTNYYFNLAQEYSKDKEFIRSNRLAFYTRQAMLEPAQALLDESGSGKYKALRSNMSVLRQLLGQEPEDREIFMPDSIESVEDFTLFFNQTISGLRNSDTTKLHYINSYLNEQENQLFFEDLLYLKGLVHHYDGIAKEARRVVENLALSSSVRSGYYYNALGIWMLEEENYKAAAHYFAQAKDLGFTQAFLSQGYALALANRPQEAVSALEEVGFTEIESAMQVAQSLAMVLRSDFSTTLQEASDKDKVQYLITYLPNLKPDEVNALVHSVEEKDLKRRALIARIDYFLDKQQWRTAYEAIKETSPYLRAEDELRSALNLQQLKLWLYTENYDALLSRMDNLYLTDRDKRYKFYFRARIADAKGRQEEAANRFDQALKVLIYDEEVVMAAADFFSRQSETGLKSYNILLDGITYNPFAVSLLKAYALESINQGLSSYAENTLATLQDLLPASEYSTFIEKFEKQRQQIEARAENWQ